MSTERRPLRPTPAPVVTEEGAFGALPPQPDARGRLPRTRSRVRRAAAHFALGVAIWLLVFAAAQISTRAAALPALERILAALTDVDGLLALQERTIRGEGAKPGVTAVAVAGFPLTSVTLTPEAARTATRPQWRETLLEKGAAALYADGMPALAQEGAGADGGLLSTVGNTSVVVHALTATRNRIALLATVVVGLVVIALAARVVRLGEGASRFVAIGLATIVGAGLAAVASVALASFLTAASLFGSSQLADEVAAVARTLAWTPLRDAMRLAIGGLVLAVISAAVAIWLGTRLDEDDLEDVFIR